MNVFTLDQSTYKYTQLLAGWLDVKKGCIRYFPHLKLRRMEVKNDIILRSSFLF